jgi:hypothetical protein
MAQHTLIDKSQKLEYWEGDGAYEAISHITGNPRQ